MMLLIVAVLVLVSGGIVFAINYLNWRSISATAQEALETLSSNSGRRPGLRGGAGEVLPGKPDGTDAFADSETEPDRTDVLSDHETESVSERIPVGEDERGAGIPDGPGGHGDDPVPKASPGQPPELEDALASLSNYYVVNLTSSDEITGWTSDRSDLYTDDLVEDILFMIDTSGSMSDDMITAAYSEVKGAIDQFDGKLKGWLGFFDAEIVEPKPFKSEDEFRIIKPEGGGGTDFQIIFEYVQQNMQDSLPASVIILTDGYAPFPAEQMAMGIPVLWLLNNEDVEPPWGKTARITV